MQNKMKIISLFSGAGGLDIGFHEAGFQTAARRPRYCSIASGSLLTVKFLPSSILNFRPFFNRDDKNRKTEGT